MSVSFLVQVGVCLALFTLKPIHLNAAEHNDRQARTPIKMEPSPIDDLRLPPSWPFSTSNQLLDDNRNELSIRLKDDLFLSKGQPDQCKRSGEHTKSISALANCLETAGLAFLETGQLSHLEPTLLNLAKNNPLIYTNTPNDFSPDRYKARSVLTVYGAFYAFYYDRFEFTDADRKAVDQYFETQLQYLNMDDVGQRNEQVFCNPRNHANIGINKTGRADINTCESNRWKATIAQLLLGIRLQNETLFRRGIYNTRFMLLAFDEKGIFVPWATRGALALHYSNEVPRFLGKLTEIYHAIGYDFLAHTLENGLKVHQLFDLYFKVFNDKSILDKYAKRQYAQKGENYGEYLDRSTAEELKKWRLTKSAFARESMRYIETYRPDLHSLVDCNFNPRQTNGEPNRLVTSFSIIDPYEFYLSNFGDDTTEAEFCQTKRRKTITERETSYQRYYKLQNGLWSLKDSENTFRLASDPATAEFTAPVKNRAFIQIKSRDTELSSAAEFIEVTPSRTSIRWFIGQGAEQPFAQLQAKSNEAGRTCGYLHRRMWGNDWDMLPILVQTDNDYDLDYQICFHEHLLDNLESEQLNIYQMLIASAQQVANELSRNAPAYAELYEQTNDGWKLQGAQGAVKIDFFKKDAGQPSQKGQIAKGFLKVKIDGQIIEEGVEFFQFTTDDSTSPEQAMVWGIWEDAIPPLDQFNAINKKIEETCGIHFSMPNDVLVFVIQTNNDDTLSRQHCFLQEYVTQSNSDIAGLYRKLLGAAPEIFARIVE